MAFFFTYKANGNPLAPKREFYELRIYQLKNSDQQKMLDDYLKDALLPALHRAGINQAGVFKSWGIDTSSNPRMYVLIPYRSLDDAANVEKKLATDKVYQLAGKDYFDTPYDKPAYQRMEKVFLQAFVDMPQLKTPTLSGLRSQRVYELRSYESPSEKYYASKIKMFNEGGEVGLFSRLGFNAIFYGEVISGSAMPNLMYMTSFENRQSRDDHWKQFVDDELWKKISKMEEYAHNVSHSDIFLLFPTDYSDY